MKKVLITGSEGFVGGHLITEMEKNGYEVFGSSFLAPEKNSTNTFLCDITNDKSISSLVSKIKPDLIFHLAAQTSPHRSWLSPQKTFEVNTIGTINLFDAVIKIKGYKPRILLIGSCVEYGDISKEDLPISEQKSLDPRSPYAISKLACYYLSLAYIRAKNLDIVYSVSFSHTGPDQSTGFLCSDIASQIALIEEGKQEAVISTGYLNNQRDYSDVRDVVRAYRLLLEKGRTGERYNVCSGRAVSTKDIFDTLTGYSKVKIKHQIDSQRSNPADVQIILGSHDKITKETDWIPEIPLEKTLRDLLNWYREKR